MTTKDSIAYGRDKFLELGIDDELFAGVLGSLMGESGRNLNTKALNPNDPNGGSVGIAQWHSQRRWALEDLAQSTGRAVDDYTAQWDHIINELRGTHKDVLEQLRGAKTRYEAARIWTDKYERPAAAHANHDGRAANADYAAELLPGIKGGNGEGRGGPGGLSASTSNGSTMGLGEAVGSLFGGGGNGGGGRGPVGAVTPGQGLAMAVGGMVAGPAGIKLANDLFGVDANLTAAEKVGMGLGGIIGGVPGAAIGQMLGQAIGGLFGIGVGSRGEVSAADWGGGGYTQTGEGRHELTGDSAAPSTSMKPQSRPDNLGSSSGTSTSSDPRG